jgi:hypothetical protein
MRGSAALRTGVAPGGALAGPWVQNSLWTRARAVPSLDLRFADNKSLVDATTGAKLVTHTRASSGTYVGSDGVIKSAVTNLLLRSEELETTWSGVATTVTPNSNTAPNGTLTADTLTDTNAAGDAYLRQSIANPLNSAIYTGSIYLKQGTTATTRVSLTFFGATTVNRDATVTWSSNTSDYGTLTSVGNGWYRLSFSETNNASGNTSLLFTIRASGDVTGAETGTVFAWGAQLEQASTVGEYIPTTSTINSAPRFDHNPTTGESLGLLVEEARTNLLLRSEEFDNAYWSKANATITADSIAAPTGATTADLLIETAATGQHRVYRGITGTTNTNPHTVSFFAKANTRTRVYVGLAEGTTFSRQGNAVFDLSTGTIVNATGGSSGATGGAATIQNFGNGWYRCTYTLIFGGTDTTVFTDINLVNTGTTISYTGDGTSGIYLWGAQLEAGSFPTSYIPTTGAAATRAADLASITGSNFSSWYRQDEGTVFADFNGTNITSGQFPRILEFNDGTGGNHIRVSQYNAGVNTVRVGAATATVTQFAADNGSVAVGVRGKTAFGSALNDAALVTNGASPTTDATYLVPSGLTRLGIGYRPDSSSNVFNSTIRRLTYWPVRLSNEVLQRITQ